MIGIFSDDMAHICVNFYTIIKYLSMQNMCQNSVCINCIVNYLMINFQLSEPAISLIVGFIVVSLCVCFLSQ